MKQFANNTMVRSKLKAHRGQRAKVYVPIGIAADQYTIGPDETLVQWLIPTSEGDWGGTVETVKTRNLVEIRKVVTVTWVDVVK